MRTLPLWLCLLGCAIARGAPEPPAEQRWHVDPDGRGKVEVLLRLDGERAKKLLEGRTDADDAVAHELLRWEGVAAWTDVESRLTAGKPSTLRAVGWFTDVARVVPPRGHGWRVRREDGAWFLEQTSHGRDASGLLDASLLDLDAKTFGLIRAGVATLLRVRAAATGVTQTVFVPGAPSQPRGATLAADPPRATVVIDLKRQQAQAALLFEALATLRQEVAAKRKTREAAGDEAFRRLDASLARVRCADPRPHAGLAAALAAAQRTWAGSLWRKRLQGARAVSRKEQQEEDVPPDPPGNDPAAFEPNDTRAQAKPLTPGSYGLHLKREDWYRIETPAKHTLVVQARFFPAFGDIDIELLDAAGERVRAALGRGRIERISVDPQGRPLWLRVFNHDRRWKQLQTDPYYTLSVTHTPYTERDRLEPNDPPHPPRVIGVGGHKQLIGDGLDVYRIKPAPAGATDVRRLKVVLRFAKEHDLDLELRTAGGALLAASRGTGETEQASSLEPPGGLEVRVLGVGPYTLEVTAVSGPARDRYEPNDTRAQAKPLRPARHTGLLLDTEDWYRLTLKPHRSLEIKAAPAAQGEADLDLELYDAQGKRLRRAATAGSSRETLRLDGAPAGVVFLRVHARGFARYSLHVVDRAFRPADRFEPNETRAAARALPLGEHAGLRCTGEDWYRLPAPPPGKRLVIELRSDVATEGDLDLELYVGGRRVAAARGLESLERLEWQGTGAPLLRVFPGSARYRLTLRHR